MKKKIILALLFILPFGYNIDAKEELDLKINNNQRSDGFGKFEKEKAFQTSYRTNSDCFTPFFINTITRNSDKSLTIRTQYGRDRDFHGKPTVFATVATGVSGAYQYNVDGKITFSDKGFRSVTYDIPFDKHYSGRTVINVHGFEGSCRNSAEIHHYTGREHIYDNVEFSLSPVQRRDRVLDWQQSTNNGIVFDKNGRWNQRFKFKKHGSSYRIVSASKQNHHLGSFYYNDVAILNAYSYDSNYLWDIEFKGYASINQTKIKLKNKKNGYYLDVAYSNYTNRNPFTTYYNTNNPNQEFVINAFKHTY